MPTPGSTHLAPGRMPAWWRKFPYLKELGVTVVELMPVFQRDPQEADYWGYMPLNFFCASCPIREHSDEDQQHLEFKNMVKALHQAGIGIVLDVVYNHTCEGDHRGPIYSYKGFDAASYYMMSSDPTNPYANYSGTGNTLEFRARARAQDGDGQLALLEKRDAH